MKSNEFFPGVRERAVRLVQERRGEYLSPWVAIESVAPKIGCVAQTLNEWVKHDQMDKGGTRMADHQRERTPQGTAT